MRLSKRQGEILRLMRRYPTLWPDYVSWKHVSAYARGRNKQGMRDQALRRTLGALERRGLATVALGDALGDYAPFNAVLTDEGEKLADKLAGYTQCSECDTRQPDI